MVASIHIENVFSGKNLFTFNCMNTDVPEPLQLENVCHAQILVRHLSRVKWRIHTVLAGPRCNETIVTGTSAWFTGSY